MEVRKEGGGVRLEKEGTGKAEGTGVVKESEGTGVVDEIKDGTERKKG